MSHVTTAVDAAPTESERPSSKARQRILATATRLFISVGIRSVGVDRLIAESEVARATFFRHFPTKDDLVVAFLRSQAAEAREQLTRVRAQPDGPRALLAEIAAGAKVGMDCDGFRGCEFVNTAAEYCDPDHPVRLVVDQHRAWVRDIMSDSLHELGHPTPVATAEVLFTMRTGAVIASSLEGFGNVDGAFDRAWWALIDQR
ncbi:TetR/AcrR family transcriptional regulator [Microbacterium elymi]|uniref:TetR/AcrR family transcriptional regulator n=1 Tax=Microbacterium elymi TaxID=2909587 RepID=A0ABY5NGP6_9MICO|nr:TetR/AcrR family transcriptional regulator [Microbacterium elymi]UUT34321.1 TetR/AcrR family transcriptional regulator [Microbacterium elymi]